MEKDPNTYTGLFDLFKNVWVIGLAMIGGLIHNRLRLKNGDIKKFSWVELFFDSIAAGFFGIMTYYICVYYALPDPLVGFACGTSGMAGGYGLSLVKSLVSGESVVEIKIKEKSSKEEKTWKMK